MVSPSQPSETDTSEQSGQALTGKVLKFRQRGSLFARPLPRPVQSPAVDDLKKYEAAPEHEPDDYRHRMIMNGLALLVTVFLVVAGVWIADVMAKMRKDQDCVLSGRRGCTPVDVVPTPR